MFELVAAYHVFAHLIPAAFRHLVAFHNVCYVADKVRFEELKLQNSLLLSANLTLLV